MKDFWRIWEDFIKSERNLKHRRKSEKIREDQGEPERIWIGFDRIWGNLKESKKFGKTDKSGNHLNEFDTIWKSLQESEAIFNNLKQSETIRGNLMESDVTGKNLKVFSENLIEFNRIREWYLKESQGIRIDLRESRIIWRTFTLKIGTNPPEKFEKTHLKESETTHLKKSKRVRKDW